MRDQFEGREIWADRHRGNGGAVLGILAIALLAFLAFLLFLLWHPQTSCCCCCQARTAATASTTTFGQLPVLIPPGKVAPRYVMGNRMLPTVPIMSVGAPVVMPLDPVTPVSKLAPMTVGYATPYDWFAYAPPPTGYVPFVPGAHVDEAGSSAAWFIVGMAIIGGMMWRMRR